MPPPIGRVRDRAETVNGLTLRLVTDSFLGILARFRARRSIKIHFRLLYQILNDALQDVLKHIDLQPQDAAGARSDDDTLSNFIQNFEKDSAAQRELRDPGPAPAPLPKTGLANYVKGRAYPNRCTDSREAADAVRLETCADSTDPHRRSTATLRWTKS